MESIRTSDLYEAAYYLSEGYPPESIACRKLNKELVCDFFYSDVGLEELQINFFSGGAQVNLLGFRRSYGELASQLSRVKREYKRKAIEAASTAPTGEVGLTGGS